MGRKITKVQFVPGRNEQIETTISLQKEARSVIHGVVVDENKRPVRDAVVKLFEMPNEKDCCTLIPLFHAFTDECGQFLFGPLAPGKKYVIKVWHKEVKIRKLPGTPFECKEPCPGTPPRNKDDDCDFFEEDNSSSKRDSRRHSDYCHDDDSTCDDCSY